MMNYTILLKVLKKKEDLRNPLHLGNPKIKVQFEELYNKIFSNQDGVKG